MTATCAVSELSPESYTVLLATLFSSTPVNFYFIVLFRDALGYGATGTFLWTIQLRIVRRPLGDNSLQMDLTM